MLSPPSLQSHEQYREDPDQRQPELAGVVEGLCLGVVRFLDDEVDVTEVSGVHRLTPEVLAAFRL